MSKASKAYESCKECIKLTYVTDNLLPRSPRSCVILGDPGADSGGEGKSKRAGKYGTKKSKERREEPLGTMSYQTSSKRSRPLWLLIGARKLLCFSAQSEGRTAATVWNRGHTNHYVSASKGGKKEKSASKRGKCVSIQM